MSLFAEPGASEDAPLAERLRPRTLDEFVGQEHIVGRSSPLRPVIDGGRLGSVILWGPAGVGKTTLARIIAESSGAHYDSRSAVTTGVAEIRKLAEGARARSKPTVLFLDEIHHFNRTQQDFLLGFVEDGTLRLIGATTENPTFSLATPLLSRCKVLVLRPLEDPEIEVLIRRGGSSLGRSIDDDALDHLVRFANGDARVALNALELADQLSAGEASINARSVALALDRPLTRYDRQGDQHYDVISAFIKSVRGSDPDAALHYLARMIRAGEDPRFIARRIVILASEDIGNAAPLGLVVATAAFHAVERIGMPEARIILAQAVILLCASPKSNTAYVAIDKALTDIDSRAAPRVPDYLRDSNSKRNDVSRDTGEYLYPHDFGGWVRQSYLEPNHDLDLPYYVPNAAGHEAKLADFLASLEREK